MTISELLRSSVTDADGQPLGSVNDVRLVQDGPYIEGFGAALRVDELIVGAGSLGVRLGYYDGRIRGPALLAWILGAMARRAHRVAWSDVASWDGTTVVLRCRAHELPRLGTPR
jgi:hypothetical protein